jgi:hypothetical protein
MTLSLEVKIALAVLGFAVGKYISERKRKDEKLPTTKKV